MAKFKFRLPLNLQLFAGTDADGVDLDDQDKDDRDLDDDQDGSEGDPEEDGLDGEAEVEFDDDDPDPEDDDLEDKTKSKTKGKENPTAAAVIAERKKWQAKLKEAEKANPLMKKLMNISGVNSMEELQQRLDEVEATTLAKNAGITPEQAQFQVRQTRMLEEMKRDIQKQKYETEAQALKKDPFFADIENYRDEFEEIAERTGQTLEEVYMAKRGRERMKEREIEIETRVKANKNKRDGKKVDTRPSSSDSKKPGSKSYNLTPDELQAAQYGVKKGHFKSIEEYAKYLKN